MNDRNNYMVEQSDVVIAVWNGKPSGTGNIVRMESIIILTSVLSIKDYYLFKTKIILKKYTFLKLYDTINILRGKNEKNFFGISME